MSLATRVAALLVLLYGARTDRIRRLTTADTSTVGQRTYLVLSTNPIEIANPVAQLLARLVTDAERNPRALRAGRRGIISVPLDTATPRTDPPHDPRAVDGAGRSQPADRPELGA